MNYFSTSLIFVAGLSCAFGLMYLFIGLRRQEERPLSLTFALFALAYAGATLAAEAAYTATSVGQYINANRMTGSFAIPAFILLVWYVALYTRVKPRPVLWFLTAVFLIIGFVNLFIPDLMYSYTGDLTRLTLPWGETVFLVGEEDTAFLPVVILAQFAVIGYVIYACVRQFLRGEQQGALVLGIGAGWFIITLLQTIFVSAGAIDFIFLSDFGFLGFALAMSLQMANTTIKTEKELAAYRLNLEEMVANRTAELEAAQERLLAQAQEQAVTAERSRLARDLHDVVTQILFSINLIAISLPRLWQRNPDIAERSTNELQRLTRGALAEMRILLRELRPQTITATDLGTLLTQLSDGIAARHDIPADVNIDPECELPPEIHLALYRIAQEAMNNIAKHAEAGHLAVDLACNETAVHLTITDDGQGFDLNDVPSAHMGLDIMGERAEAIGAELTINSRPGAGTSIAVVWPLPQAGE